MYLWCVIGRVMLSCYKNPMGTQATIRSPIGHKIIQNGQVLNIEQQVLLCEPFTIADIKEALFSIPNHKSPKLDGFNSGFFKHSWIKIGDQICNAVQDFFRTGIMPDYVSAMKLVVLPKVPNPHFATEFRPISYCNVLYKCISKLICTRINETLPSIISHNQTAFVSATIF